jgi:signal transduction histidine kinase
VTLIHRLKKSSLNLPMALAAVCLVVIAFYTWVYFVINPYFGLSIDTPVARINKLFVKPAGETGFQPGDIIQSVGALNWAEQAALPNMPFFPPVEVGEVVPFTVLREGQTVVVNWWVPGFNWAEFTNRFIKYWYLAYIFWIFGLLSLVLLFPRDLRAGLMSALFFAIGLWIIFGAVASTHMLYSGTLLRMTSWALLAIGIHFHWIFPRPLIRLDRWVYWLLYLICAGFALAELFQLLPSMTYLYVIVFTVLVSQGLLLVNFLLHPDLRQQVGLPLLVIPFILMILIPTILLIYISGLSFLDEVGILVLVVLPVTYFYVLYSRQVGGMQFRAHLTISRLVFVTLVFMGAAILATLCNLISDDMRFLAIIGVITTILAAWAGVAWYPKFEAWFEKRFLGMPVPPARLLPWYSARLAESLDVDRLVELLQAQIFPVLLVRQAALVRWQGNPDQPETCKITSILNLQVSEPQLPLPEDLPYLLHAAGKVIPENLKGQTVKRIAWVRLAINLAIEGKTIGLCLLGRRDPDDAYAPSEIQLLQALMDQTALALVHIDLARRLRDFLQADIQRQEAERSQLARELHDELLSKMAVIAQDGAWLGEDSAPGSQGRSLQAYQEAVQEIRGLISNLRSGVLSYGLDLALEDLCEEIQENPLNRPQPAQVMLDLSGNHYRYPEEVELHLFRIAQQACLNALQHARARTIQISGDFQPTRILLKISDDGAGFQTRNRPDLAQLLVQKQFGIVGMVERALLIQADLTLDSAPGKGTVICVAWQESGFAKKKD